MLRTHYWLCAQGSLLVMFRGPYLVPGFKMRLATWKASYLPTQTHQCCFCSFGPHLFLLCDYFCLCLEVALSGAGFQIWARIKLWTHPTKFLLYSLLLGFKFVSGYLNLLRFNASFSHLLTFRSTTRAAQGWLLAMHTSWGFSVVT